MVCGMFDKEVDSLSKCVNVGIVFDIEDMMFKRWEKGVEFEC